MKILLEAGTSSSFLLSIYKDNKFYNLHFKTNLKDKTRYLFTYYNKYVTKLSLILSLRQGQKRGKSAMVHNKKINYDAIQRLNAGDLIFPYLVGLIEGDGWFSITKNGKYLKYEFGIELSIRDIQLLYKIKELLGVGTIDFRENSRRATANLTTLSEQDNTISSNRCNAQFRIRNKTHLKNIVIPIFDKYPLLSNKNYDYLRFKEVLLSDIIFSKDLIEYVRPTGPTINTYLTDNIQTKSFEAWLIGFIEAEGCFSIYKPTSDSSKVASFDISQTNGYNLINIIKIHLNLTSSIYTDKTKNSKLKVSSVRQIENVVKFINKAPIKLMGYKKLSYLLFIKELRKISRYSNKFRIPNKY